MIENLKNNKIIYYFPQYHGFHDDVAGILPQSPERSGGQSIQATISKR